MLNILTYNVRYGKKIKGIAEWISEFPNEIDILCFQEFPVKKIQEFMSLLPHKDFAYEFAEGFLYKGRDFGQLTLFNTRKISCLKASSVNLGKPGLVEGKFFKTTGERSALITTFAYNGKTFSLVNTHLIWLAFNKARRRQIDIITEFLSGSKNDTPAVILGDFNYSSLVTRKTLTRFMEESEFTDATGKLKTHKLFMFTPAVKHQIDYVFSRKCEVQNPKVFPVNYSDHYPLVFSLSV